MRVLGLAVDYNKRPTLRAVLLDRSEADQSIHLETKFEVPASDGDDLATQLNELATAISARVSSLKPDAVILRRADRPARPSNQDGPRFRLMAEGAVVSAVRAIVQDTFVRNGKECGQAFGADKAGVDAAAAKHVTAAMVPACAAALSGLAKLPQ
ncbi:hypothetical protein [Agromyces sp. NPDC058104]|uniref:hypothetical protein n=1 Tax=Agromyces sp. NPDC058104 TaxID=3346342 RepID=UPI0036DA9729